MAISKVTPVPVHEVSSKLFKALLFELSNVANSSETKLINIIVFLRNLIWLLTFHPGTATFKWVDTYDFVNITTWLKLISVPFTIKKDVMKNEKNDLGLLVLYLLCLIDMYVVKIFYQLWISFSCPEKLTNLILQLSLVKV